MYCSKCGKQVADGMKFCPECGNGFKSSSEVKMIQLKCSSCGANMEAKPDEQEVFCRHCGSRILIMDSDAVAIEKIRNRTLRDLELTRMNREDEKQLKKEQKEERESYKKSKFGKVTIAMAVICLICVFSSFSEKHILAGLVALIQSGLFGASWAMGIQMIKEKRKHMHLLLAIAGFVLFVPFSYANSLQHYDRLTWPSGGIASAVPKPNEKYGYVTTNSEDRLYVTLYKFSEKDFEKYVSQCNKAGFSIEVERYKNNYEAFNEDGYLLHVVRYSEDTGRIEVDAPFKMGVLVWPENEKAEKIPHPSSNKGKTEYEHSDGFLIYVGETDANAFSDYVQKVYDAGYNVDYQKSETHYSAKDENGNLIRIEYEGFNRMSVQLQIRKDEPVAEETKPVMEVKEETDKPEVKTEETVNSEAQKTETENRNSNSLDPNLKQFLDSYEALIDDYIVFMKKYETSDNSLAMATDYLTMMTRYMDATDKLDDWDENEMSDADLAYYIEVTTRCSTKLMNASIY